ncbi:putative receptor-like protein kinase At4g00960 [Benincasa hispida]|uniref:putative receptor-like protein kinase At4g00960 n=1 Tax=Benincasa hispida TaxID=102211 RepID=UPI0018FF2341|nr:putative receptor-like protein kinase At4g00960 [Benincasa hispida]
MMETSKSLLFLCVIHLFMVSTTISQQEFIAHSCSNIGNYSRNSFFKRNLDTLLSSILSNSQIDYGFYNFSAGQQPDKVNAIALCRGDWTVEQCKNCLNDSALKIVQTCPNQKEAIGWYNDCMLRYSNDSIFGVANVQVLSRDFNTGNSSNVDGFSQALRNLLARLQNQASSGSSTLKFAVGDTEGPSIEENRIYGLVQCTPDLSFMDCTNCFGQLNRNIPTGKIGARIFAVSCFLRYEIYLFYTPPPPLPPPSPPPSPPPPLPPTLPPAPGNNSNNRTVIIVMVSIASAIIFIVAICIILRIRKAKNRRPLEKFGSIALGDGTNEISSVETIRFDFDTIKIATNAFSSENKLGQGGFGAVYMGKLPNGQQIAVKRLAHNSQQGDVEFKNEVLLVVNLQHRNLVRLLGFCLHGSERLLIYEFVPNGSLDNFIFDFGKRTLLIWERRFKIINGIARGLLYLHEDSRLRIIHRDLKASNILLDEEMNPKIADFGLARLFEVDETQGNTSRIVGTYGYMAPEYVIHGQFSVKSDVFSFGILILEILSGQKNNCFRNGENVEDLSSFAWKNWRAGTITNVIDSTLLIGSRTEMIRCIHIGLLCIQENVANRPTMASIFLMLSSSSLTLPIPSKPPFFRHSNSTYESNTMLKLDGTSNSGSSTLNDISITKLHPR